jgi:hypothetical protein
LIQDFIFSNYIVCISFHSADIFPKIQFPFIHVLNMPFATHWKCHNCQNVFSIAGYVECPLCHHRRCHSCRKFAVGNRSNNYQSNSRSGDYAPAMPRQQRGLTSSTAASSSQSRGGDESEVASSPSTRLSAPKSSLGTDIYACCQCDSQGPQVWQHNRLCSGCSHAACPYCLWYETKQDRRTVSKIPRHIMVTY